MRSHAVDVKTGNEVVISEGCLRDGVLATIALPGIFPPHHLNEWELMDGGVLNPVPVSVARMLSPDLPIVLS
jgi:NTE family protein